MAAAAGSGLASAGSSFRSRSRPGARGPGMWRAGILELTGRQDAGGASGTEAADTPQSDALRADYEAGRERDDPGRHQRNKTSARPTQESSERNRPR